MAMTTIAAAALLLLSSLSLASQSNRLGEPQVQYKVCGPGFVVDRQKASGGASRIERPVWRAVYVRACRIHGCRTACCRYQARTVVVDLISVHINGRHNVEG